MRMLLMTAVASLAAGALGYVAAAVWTVDHHFGIEPSVNVVTGGNVVEADIAHPTTAQTVITFSSPQSGTAHLRR